jgi:hypothetical protein
VQVDFAKFPLIIKLGYVKDGEEAAEVGLETLPVGSEFAVEGSFCTKLTLMRMAPILLLSTPPKEQNLRLEFVTFVT